MKAVMYHYVRPHSGGMPYFRYLWLENFRRQLDYFERAFGFVEREVFLASIDAGRPLAGGVVLTFDDGISNHYEHVFPELQRRGLWGTFYVPTGMYASGRVLGVHRIHLLLGCYGSTEIFRALQGLISPHMLSHEHVEEFRSLTYRTQTNDELTTLVKRTLNYFVSYEYRDAVLDALMARFFGNERRIVTTLYLAPERLRAMQDAGMIIGSHSVTHPVFSKLAEDEQRRELAESFAFLEEATGGLTVRTFCYPYGGDYSFTATTERLLDELGCRFAFNVAPRDITAEDLAGRPQALPRYDCNQFPHGLASFGDVHPDGDVPSLMGPAGSIVRQSG